MLRDMPASIISTFRPRTLLPALTAGLIAGVLSIVVAISFGAMIFSGSLSSFAARGIGYVLFGAVTISLINAVGSTFPSIVALPQDGPAAILAVIAGLIAAQLGSATTPDRAFATLVAVIVLTSILTGVTSFLLGRFQLGNLIRYIPYPVVGGFLAGTGYFLVQGGFGVMADANFTLSRLAELVQPGLLIRWLPGVIFGAALLLILRRHSHFLIIPSMLAGAVVLFYVVLLLTNTSVDQASKLNLLLGPFPESGLWQSPDPAMLGQVDWPILAGQVGNIASIVLISIFSLLLNLSGLEVVAKRDINLNRELQTSGLANMVAGLGGGTPGYAALSVSALGSRLGAQSRVVGAVVGLVCCLTLFVGASALTFFPRFVLGGLLFFLGLSFLVEWLFDGWFRFRKPDYLIIVAILVVMASVGVLAGVAVGMVFAVIFFVVDYSRVEVVKHEFSGDYYRSNVERSRLEEQILAEKGGWLHVLELQGFIFFGTANRLLDRVHRRLTDPGKAALRYVVLDFRRVSGLDVSAVISFVKMKQLAQSRQLVFVFTHLSPAMQSRLEKDVFTAADHASWCVFPDLDRGVEWCEAQTLKTFEEVGLSFKRRAGSPRLDDLLPNVGGQGFLESMMQDVLPGYAETSGASLLSQVATYFERQEVGKDHVLVRQGEKTGGLYFVESGQVTVLRKTPDDTLRLRLLNAGTVIGEVGFYTGTAASATVITTQPSVVLYASAEKLRAMEESDPDAATVLHKFLARLLSERLARSTNLLDAAVQ